MIIPFGQTAPHPNRRARSPSPARTLIPDRLDGLNGAEGLRHLVDLDERVTRVI